MADVNQSTSFEAQTYRTGFAQMKAPTWGARSWIWHGVRTDAKGMLILDPLMSYRLTPSDGQGRAFTEEIGYAQICYGEAVTEPLVPAFAFRTEVGVA